MQVIVSDHKSHFNLDHLGPGMDTPATNSSDAYAQIWKIIKEKTKQNTKNTVRIEHSLTDKIKLCKKQ